MTNPLSAKALMSDVISYAELGEHRTASSVDLAASEWIRAELSAAGLTAELDPWPLRQFQNIDCALRVFGKDFDAFPLWHPSASGPAPIDAPIVPAEDLENLPGAIALVQFPDVMVTPKSAHAEIIEALSAAGARAIIGCTPHKSGAIYGQNVIPPFHQTPWPLPVLMISPSDWHVFAAAAEHRVSVEFKLDGTDQQDARANNVVAYQKRGARWMIVSTPQSGWFRSAGERGAGVAMLLGLARWMTSLDTDHSLLFLSNTGHEIGHMGAFHALNSPHLPKPIDTDCWLHLGSSIGTRDFETENHLLVPAGPPEPSWLFASQDMIARLNRAFQDLPHLKPELYNRNHGEIRWILERGYSAFSLMGPQQFFHLKSDGPETVSGQLLERVGGALAETLYSVMSQSDTLPLAN